MKKSILIISIILTILAMILLIFLLNFRGLTGQVIVADYHTRTKAICNTESCQDYLISCNGTDIISQTPITESIEKPTNWTDPRNNSKNLCE